jgi:hypothetical protein
MLSSSGSTSFTTLKRWNGSSWGDATIFRRWNGSSWIDVTN